MIDDMKIICSTEVIDKRFEESLTFGFEFNSESNVELGQSFMKSLEWQVDSDLW